MMINNNLVGAAAAGRRQPRPLAGDRGRLRARTFNDVIQRRRRRPERSSAAPGSPAATRSTRPAWTASAACSRPCSAAADRRSARPSWPPLSAAGTCPLTGGDVWGEGNILLGGGGSDTITGRGGNDIIDGDKCARRPDQRRVDPTDPRPRSAAPISWSSQYLNGRQRRTRPGPTLQAAVFNGHGRPGRPRDRRARSSTAPARRHRRGHRGVPRQPRASYTITLDGRRHDDGQADGRARSAPQKVERRQGHADATSSSCSSPIGRSSLAGSAALAPLGLAFADDAAGQHDEHRRDGDPVEHGAAAAAHSAVTMAGANPDDFAMLRRHLRDDAGDAAWRTPCNISVTFKPTRAVPGRPSCGHGRRGRHAWHRAGVR